MQTLRKPGCPTCLFVFVLEPFQMLLKKQDVTVEDEDTLGLEERHNVPASI
jgi:hypothetical protein